MANMKDVLNLESDYFGVFWQFLPNYHIIFIYLIIYVSFKIPFLFERSGQQWVAGKEDFICRGALR